MFRCIMPLVSVVYRKSPAEHPLQLTTGTALKFGLFRPLGNRLVWDVIGHVVLGQLNVAFGGLRWNISCYIYPSTDVETPEANSTQKSERLPPPL